jgi:hypothetical protein
MKLLATLKSKEGETTQHWELIECNVDEELMVLISKLQNSEWIGIPVHKNLIEQAGQADIYKFKYPAFLDISKAEFIYQIKTPPKIKPD